MKYENASRASQIVKQIEKELRLLNELSSENLVVTISNGHYQITSIGTITDDYSLGLFSNEFLKSCRDAIEFRIKGLKADLELL